MNSFEINQSYKAMVANTANQAMASAITCHAEKGTTAEVAAAARKVLENAGSFGKNLDRSVRRMCKAVTGVELQPGEGSGTIRPDGTVSYRSTNA